MSYNFEAITDYLNDRAWREYEASGVFDDPILCDECDEEMDWESGEPDKYNDYKCKVCGHECRIELDPWP